MAQSGSVAAQLGARPAHRHAAILRGADGHEERVESSGLVLLLGAEPCADYLPDVVARDARGFVVTGRDVPPERWRDGVPPAALETTVPGIFAAGDIRVDSMKRVAAASGEGASVVPLVHAFLAPVPDSEVAGAPVG